MTELISHEKKIKVLRSTANGEEDKRFGTTQINNNSGVNKDADKKTCSADYLNELKASCLKDVEKLEEKRLHPINFDGIIGHEDLKEEILLAIAGKLCEDEQSKAYLESIDDHAVTGILLDGLPGVGKSSILRAIEKSLKNHPEVDCKSLDCSDFQGGVGTNAKRINETFEEARNTKKECCVILVDEIDSVMRKKRGLLNDAERTNAMQTNMDGMKDSSKIIMIVTTNDIGSMEDASISRFSVIRLGLPGERERKALIEKFILPIPMETPLNIDIVARYTEGLTGRNFRDIGKNLSRKRAINKKPISLKDLTLMISKFAHSSKRLLNIEDELNKDNCQNLSSPFINNNKEDIILNNVNKGESKLYTVDNNGTELTKNILSFESSWGLGQVNSSNLVEFSIRFIDAFNPQYPTTGDYYTPSAIRGIAAKIFKITPGVN